MLCKSLQGGHGALVGTPTRGNGVRYQASPKPLRECALASSVHSMPHTVGAAQKDSSSNWTNAARFPEHRDLAGFDFEVSKVDRKLVMTLADTSFTEQAHNAVLVGGPGTGKTHLATAISLNTITRYGKRVRFHSTVDLVNSLEQEKTQGRAGRIAASLLKMDLVILDELGYLPFSQAGGALLFHLLSKEGVQNFV